jgi:hypothetical protein
MLRVTKFESAGQTSFKLEGKLAGNWVEVMEQCWREAAKGSAQTPVAVDLSGITYVDGPGTDLLCAMHKGGVELRATTCLGRGIVEQVRSCSEEPAEDRY